MNDSAEERGAFAAMVIAVYELYGKRPSDEILEMWWAALAAFDLQEVRGALSRHVTNPDTGQFLPKPADVVREIGGTTADASLLAWSKVNDAIRHVGTWQSVAFDDHIIHRAVVEVGGWVFLGTQTEKEWPFIEKRFRDAYRARLRRGLDGVEVPSHLAGQIEIHNAAAGWLGHVPNPVLIGDQRKAALVAGGSAQVLLENKGKGILSLTPRQDNPADTRTKP